MDFELTAEQEALRRRARELADTVFAARAARWDATEEYPWENVKDLVAAGFMGMTIPRTHGGPEHPALDVVLVIEQVARACGVTGRIVVEGNLGVVGALTQYGSEAQKRRYFPWVLEGEKPAIAISEPAAGSAATDLATSAEEVAGGLRLQGHKSWITGAGTSRLYLVFARFGGRPGAEGIGGVLVERDTPGFRIGRRELMMGLRGIPEGELHFEDCVVPREHLLVGPGDGFKKLMRAYNGQRLGAATVALGLAQGAYERALAYAGERRQFGRPIADFQGIRWKLADMAVKLDAARLLIHRAAARAGRGFPDALEAAKAKTFAAETAQEVTSQALQIHGAAGYGRSLPLERMMRDARMFAIGGGTLEMMRNLIADHVLPTRADWRRA
ncbi:MAG: acyl-CoA dehydrogenase [Candidatus Rokubacteria bacterium RIFCSPHIGHO2_12_FULL_73_22]|nr:MAG: acyl-CoA dehydrogenase [Candidatus Rokubacteria bacterium RIFCSPHIGHO2_12_FULL_73_22]OGL10726.1 MAG: acyl-CoA dehydrogenase [Candidatus Rokubacteria bacterium RIFCSPLOWO2_02_FULL_73_56]OGL20981.1 MAG: acyl-CoA dehydrogenase [Candidatus Rokubacteria bacterium RIFCSPLOWO2_12_FULL_73_47]